MAEHGGSITAKSRGGVAEGAGRHLRLQWQEATAMGETNLSFEQWLNARGGKKSTDVK